MLRNLSFTQQLKAFFSAKHRARYTLRLEHQRLSSLLDAFGVEEFDREVCCFGKLAPMDKEESIITLTKDNKKSIKSWADQRYEQWMAEVRVSVAAKQSLFAQELERLAVLHGYVADDATTVQQAQVKAHSGLRCGSSAADLTEDADEDRPSPDTDGIIEGEPQCSEPIASLIALCEQQNLETGCEHPMEKSFRRVLRHQDLLRYFQCSSHITL